MFHQATSLLESRLSWRRKSSRFLRAAAPPVHLTGSVLTQPSKVRATSPLIDLASSDSYSAGYYSYLWSDVITADAFGAFVEGKGPYDKAVAERLRKHVFSIGNTTDPADAYRAFRGRDPKIDALMKKRGFTPKS